MKKKITFLKTLLVAAGLLGSNVMWAEAGDVTVNADIDFSNAITDGAVVGTVNSMVIGGESYIDTDNWLRLKETGDCVITIPEAERAQSKDIVNIQFKMGWGNKNGMGSGFSLKDATGEAICNFTYARWGGGSNTLNIDMSGLVGAQQNNAPIKARYTIFDITVNYAARTITSVVECVNTDGKGTHQSGTFTASLTNTNPIATFNAWGYNVGGHTDRADAIDEIFIKTTEGDYSVTTYDYTVNWVCDGTTIKSAIRQGEKGASISLFDTDKAAFTESSQKYIYVSDDASEKTVADDGSTVVTVTVRKAEVWNYTIQAVDESDVALGTISTGTVVEGESLYYYYPTFYLAGTDLLKSDINDKTYGRSVTPAGNNETYKVTYKNKGIADVVFYKECEDIEGLTSVSAGNVPARCSNGKGAMAESATTIATLAPGKYKMSGFAWGNSGTVFTLTADETEVATFTTASSTVNVSTSEEFVILKSTDIVLGAQGNGGTSPKVIDFIYIQKTGDIQTLASTSQLEGYKTFYNEKKSFEVDENTTIYKAAQVSGGKVVITAVEGKVIPAGTPVILKTTAADYQITLTETTATSTNVFSDNALQAATADGVVTGAYILAYTTADGLGFYNFTGSLDAGDVYVTAAAGAKLRIALAEDDATGIQTVATEAAQDGAIYNVAGQRVNAAYKGIIIKNGKKYLNK